MRALICREWCEFRDLTIEKVPEPVLTPGGVRIRVNYASISFAINLMVAGKYQHKDALPFIPGKEVAGIVSEVAPDVTHVKIGDRVVGIADNGAFAEEIIVPKETTYLVPEGVDLKSAIHIPLSYGTAYASLVWRGKIQPGETVLVHGSAGGLGYAAMQLSRRLGARVIASASTPERQDFAAAGGAHVTVSASNFRDIVKKETNGRGADVIFDPVGGSVFEESLRAVAQNGRILIVGFAGGDIPQIPANLLLVKNVTVHGVYFGTQIGGGLVDERKIHAPRVQKMIRTMFGWAKDGEITPAVSAAYPLDQFRDAMELLLSRKSQGKVALEIRAPS